MRAIRSLLCLIICVLSGSPRLIGDTYNSIVITGNTGEIVTIPIENKIIRFNDNSITFSSELDSQSFFSYNKDIFRVISFSNQNVSQKSLIFDDTESLIFDPRSNILKLNNSSAEAYQIRVYTPDGRMIFQSSYNNNGSVQLPNLQKGLYIAIAQKESTIIKTKIYIQ